MRYITLHTSATQPSQDIGVKEIRDWHVNGNGWSDIGYHEVLRRDGTWEEGRDHGRTGAHVGGHNTGNYGICMVGGIREGGSPNNHRDFEDNYTDAQWASLYQRMKQLHEMWPNAIIMGHNGFPGHESRGCPCFDWKAWRADFLSSLKEEEVELPSHWIDEIDHDSQLKVLG